MRINRVLPTYSGLHQRLGPVRGQLCADCHRPATDWSLRKDAPREHLQADRDGRHAGRPFSLDPADYTARCRRCHIIYDGGRARQQGSAGTNAKLTASQAGEILRQALTGGISQRAIGARYGVCPSTVGLIKRRRTWAHLADIDAVWVETPGR